MKRFGMTYCATAALTLFVLIGCGGKTEMSAGEGEPTPAATTVSQDGAPAAPVHHAMPVRERQAREREQRKAKHPTAFAVQGAVIADQDGGRMKYYKKCERCGYVSSSGVSTSVPGTHTSYRSSFTCPKCKNRQQIVIKSN